MEIINEKQDRKEQLFALLMPKVAPVVEAFKTRYRLHGRRFKKRDFFRIATLEHIDIANGPEFAFMTGCDQVLGAYMRFPNTQTKAIWLRSFYVDTPESLEIETMAHELGHHFLMHKGGDPRNLLLKRSDHPDWLGESQRELEADLFAKLTCLTV